MLPLRSALFATACLMVVATAGIGPVSAQAPLQSGSNESNPTSNDNTVQNNGANEPNQSQNDAVPNQTQSSVVPSSTNSPTFGQNAINTQDKTTTQNGATTGNQSDVTQDDATTGNQSDVTQDGTEKTQTNSSSPTFGQNAGTNNGQVTDATGSVSEGDDGLDPLKPINAKIAAAKSQDTKDETVFIYHSNSGLYLTLWLTADPEDPKEAYSLAVGQTAPHAAQTSDGSSMFYGLWALNKQARTKGTPQSVVLALPPAENDTDTSSGNCLYLEPGSDSPYVNECNFANTNTSFMFSFTPSQSSKSMEVNQFGTNVTRDFVELKAKGANNADICLGIPPPGNFLSQVNCSTPASLWGIAPNSILDMVL
ncbi:MAG: hypothetical protein DHS80DRAFT_24492 [Piptocephalis tieghemiana]|nr:MAG: hypothetical protein DHS80DRAFT_24492 [Piptocephalis tieghemiana]